MSHRLAKAAYRKSRKAFTLVEILVVVAIIGILLGLIALGGFGMLKVATISTCKTQVSALGSALSAYQVDFGAYPPCTSLVGPNYDAETTPAQADYVAASTLLFTNLWGNTSFNGGTPKTGRTYFPFKLSQIANPTGNSYIQDGFGYSIGYSTYYNNTGTNNYDLWSTIGSGSTNSMTWVTNWQ
jgi:prepilin-type N-terminal cleavage/methylation domain-containing protein